MRRRRQQHDDNETVAVLIRQSAIFAARVSSGANLCTSERENQSNLDCIIRHPPIGEIRARAYRGYWCGRKKTATQRAIAMRVLALLSRSRTHLNELYIASYICGAVHARCVAALRCALIARVRRSCVLCVCVLFMLSRSKLHRSRTQRSAVAVRGEHTPRRSPVRYAMCHGTRVCCNRRKQLASSSP